MEVFWLAVEFRGEYQMDVHLYATQALLDQGCSEIGAELADNYECERLSDEARDHGPQAWLYQLESDGILTYGTGISFVHDGTPKD